MCLQLKLVERHSACALPIQLLQVIFQLDLEVSLLIQPEHLVLRQVGHVVSHDWRVTRVGTAAKIAH